MCRAAPSTSWHAHSYGAVQAVTAVRIIDTGLALVALADFRSGAMGLVYTINTCPTETVQSLLAWHGVTTGSALGVFIDLSIAIFINAITPV